MTNPPAMRKITIALSLMERGIMSVHAPFQFGGTPLPGRAKYSDPMRPPSLRVWSNDNRVYSRHCAWHDAVGSRRSAAGRNSSLADWIVHRGVAAEREGLPRHLSWDSPLAFYQYVLQYIKMLEHETGPNDDGGKGIVSHRNGKARFPPDDLIEISQQRSASSEYDAIVYYVGR